MKICLVYLGPLKYRGRLLKQISSLQKAGHECVLINGRTESQMPDYSQYSFEIISYRVYERKFKLLTFASQLLFNLTTALRILKIKPSAVVCLALGGALSGALAKAHNDSIRYYYDCNELILESISSHIKRIIWRKIQNYVLRNADVIFHAEQNRMQYFNSKYPNKAYSFLLENLPFFQCDLQDNHKTHNHFVYLGGLMPNRHIEEMISAFSELDSKCASLDIVGFGVKEYEEHIASLCAACSGNNVRLLSSVAHSEIYEFLKQYDVGLAFYSDTNLNNYYCAPNKVYDYIQMGLPVICNDFPGLLDVVQKNKVGICISEVNIHQIQNAVNSIMTENFFDNITDSLRRRYSWENQEPGYLKLFCHTISNS